LEKDNKPEEKEKRSRRTESEGKGKGRKGGKRAASLIVMGLVIIGIIGMFSSSNFFLDKLFHKNAPSLTPTLAPTATIPASPSPTPEPDLSAHVVLTSVGDIILHQAVIDGGLQKDGTYQFDYIFEHVASYFNQSDYTIANYEGTLNGPPYSGYPMFGGPDAIVTALKNAGVDMVTTANNHAFDRGLAGLIRTPQVFQNEGIKVIGTRSNAQDPKFQIVELNGIKIGIAGYTYETTGTDTGKALNGMPLPAEANDLVDSFNPYRTATYEKNKAEMAARIQAMRDAKAECIVIVLHWGEEYKTASDDTQQKLAQFLADQGVDVIFGAHSHVIQEISVVSSMISGKSTLVYYSLGNFLANMNFTTQGTNGYAQDAIIAKVAIDRDKKGIVHATEGGYIGTYVYRPTVSGKLIHKIIPVKAALAAPEKYGMEKQVQLLIDSAARIENVLAKSKGTQESVLIKEYAP